VTTPLSPVLLRSLVPPEETTPPAGFTVVDDDLTQGLPALLPLTPRLSLGLVLPTGRVRSWVDADPDAVVSAHPPTRPSSDATGLSWPDGDFPPPLRLVLLADQATVAAMPLTAASTRLLPDDGPLLAERVLAWRITVGAVVGAPVRGCRLRVAWRPVTGADPAGEFR
jgi:hypothetical protein